MLQVLFSLTLLLSAALLFWVQLFTSKMILPVLGGSASVWNTCLMFFQIALLLGYLYAYATEKWVPRRFRIFMHPLLLLIAGMALPVSLKGINLPTGNMAPVLWQLKTLVLIIGAPFLILSGTAPLLQAWFGSSREKSASDPYFLYAASNLGSFGALLSYPLLVEPLLRLTEQSLYWTIGYFLLAAMILLCALAIYTRHSEDTTPELPPQKQAAAYPSPSTATYLRWIVLAFVPSSLLLGVTTHLTADVASVPFLWIIPLALYLLSFVIAFQTFFKIHMEILNPLQAILLVFVATLLFLRIPHEGIGIFTMHLIAFFMTALFCHYELARTRPSTRDLTTFYLLISFGGALGGIFNALLAPLLFNDVIEYPLILIAACLLRQGLWPQRQNLRAAFGDFIFPAFILALLIVGGQFRHSSFDSVQSYAPWIRSTATLLLWGLYGTVPAIIFFTLFSFRQRTLRFALGITALIVAALFITPDRTTLMKARDFYGVYKVIQTGPPLIHSLFNGTTSHGFQWQTPETHLKELGYYHRRGPLGQLFKALDGTDLTRRVGMIGLGTGTVACYGKPGEAWTYFEISPTDIAIASNPDYFTFLQDCPVHPEIIASDARLSLARQPDHSFDMMIVDAFTSDAIPVHLITREALQLYLAKLRPDGLIVIHISNIHFDFGPVLGNIAASLNLAGRRWTYIVKDQNETRTGEFSSDWVVLAHNDDDLKMINNKGGWHPLKSAVAGEVWTDDYSNLFGALRW